MIEIKRLFKKTFENVDGMPSLSLAFFSLILLALAQIPVYMLISSGYLSVGIFINEIVAIAGIPLLLTYFMKFDFRRLFPMGRLGGGEFATLFFAMISLDVLIDYLTMLNEYFFPVPLSYKIKFQELLAVSDVGDVVFKFVLLCILPAVCEEIFFRGFLQRTVGLRRGNILAIVTASVMFAVFHGNPWYLHLYLIIGAFLGLTYLYAGTLLAPIFCHMVNNAWTFFGKISGCELPVGADFTAADLILAFVALSVLTACAVSMKSACRR